MNKPTLKNPSVLAFERKLANSDGLLFAGNWTELKNPDEWKPVIVQEKSIRGTISNRVKKEDDKDPAKLDTERTKANLQTIDTAALPFDADTLKVSFTLRVLGSLQIPSSCNNPDYEAALAEKINQYHKTHGFRTLATRYAHNLANGRFLWRNRVGAEALTVRITGIDNQWEFNSDDTDLSLLNLSDSQCSKLQAVAELIRTGLSGEAFVFLTVEGFCKLGQGQEVFPSQELVLDENNKNKKSKILYRIHGKHENQAAIHSQKIGNALRTIDTWHPKASEVGPIPIEPYGAVTSRGEVYRQGNDSFYKLLDNWVLKNEMLAEEQQHYVIANLIRGGVFGESDKEKAVS